MRHRIQPDLAGRSRKRRALLAGGVVLGIGAVGTMAAWSGDAWVSATFSLADVVDIQSGAELTGTFEDHDSQNALEMFSSPLSLIPGQTDHAHFFIQTTSVSTAATVLMAPAGDTPAPGTSESALWTSFIEYQTRVVDAAEHSDCSADVFDATPQGEVLVPAGSGLDYTPTQTFDLLPRGDSTMMVCFQFTLRSSAATADPSVNGTTIEPVWTFTGETPSP